MTRADLKSNKVSLALQGGGTHAAFAWGALDKLLDDNTLDIQAISATSGGAMNAVVMAYGLIHGGPDGARNALQDFWKKVSVAMGLLPFKPTMMDNMLSSVGLDFSASSMALDYFTKIFSPYQFNLFDFNPLKGIIEEMVDFEVLQESDRIKLFINATHVPSGKVRVFTNEELNVDAVMAASCLPYIFRTVYVDGAPYWDGGYSANPALMPLIDSGAEDIILIETTPLIVEDVPTKATDILDRATEVSFASSLRKEVEWIERSNELIASGALKASPVNLHFVESEEALQPLGRASKINADWDFLIYLRDLGIQGMNDFLHPAEKPKLKHAK